jgi:DNA modification methylase
MEPPPGGPRLVWVDPGSITPNANNWRIHTVEQTQLVDGLISDPAIGWAGAALYNRATGEFIDGHLRRDVAIKNGIDRIPVLVGEWTPEAQAAIHASLDPSAGMAQADPAALRRLLAAARFPAGIKGIMAKLAAGLGVEPEDAADADGDGTDGDGTDGDDGPSAADQLDGLRRKWGCESGQVWALAGPGGSAHRLAIGDSTDQIHIHKLLKGARPDLVCTSPPYADQREYADNPGAAPWADVMGGVFACLPTNPETQILVNLGLAHDDGEFVEYWQPFHQYMQRLGWRKFGWYVWDQLDGKPGDFHGRLAPCFEFIFHYNKIAIDPNRVTPTKTAGSISRRRTLRSSNQAEDSDKPGSFVTAEFKIPDAVIRCPTAGGQGIAHLHPAIMPIELACKLIEIYSAPGGRVYDPFGGAGTTLLAAESVGRAAYLSELAPAYAALSLERATLAGLACNLAR